jgi:hypothetical protein
MDRTKTRHAYNVPIPRCLTDSTTFSLRSLISATLSVRGTALIVAAPLVVGGLSIYTQLGWSEFKEKLTIHKQQMRLFTLICSVGPTICPKNV